MISPLHEAASNGTPADIADLVSAGANINVREGMGETQLRWSVDCENPKIIIALLKAGADPKAKNKVGKIPWDYAKDNEALKGNNAFWRLKDLRS